MSCPVSVKSHCRKAPSKRKPAEPAEKKAPVQRRPRLKDQWGRVLGGRRKFEVKGGRVFRVGDTVEYDTVQWLTGTRETWTGKIVRGNIFLGQATFQIRREPGQKGAGVLDIEVTDKDVRKVNG